MKAVADEIRLKVKSEIVNDTNAPKKREVCVDSESTDAAKPKVPSAQGVFSCIVDEARDNSCTEMMSVCVRYVYDVRIRERFLGFIRLGKMDAQTISTELVKFPEDMWLRHKKVHCAIVRWCFSDVRTCKGCLDIDP